MIKKLLICVCALLFFGIAQAEERITIPIGDSPSKGPVDAPVTIIEFIDFQ